MVKYIFLWIFKVSFVPKWYKATMYLENLSLVNFKNYNSAEFEFSPSINCFTGNNGVGKTNVLDAVYYLSLCKSYFNAIDSQNIHHGNEFFVIEGSYQIDGKEEKIYCGQKRGHKKKFSRNKKEYKKLSSHIGMIPVVMVSPSDIRLIVDGSEERRKFIDAVIAQYNHGYLTDIINYNKALMQRNLLLKQFSEKRYFDQGELEIWDYQLVLHGKLVYAARKKFVHELVPVFQEYYHNISGSKEEVTLQYKSDLDDGDFEDILQQAQAKDRILNYSSKGVHRDDLIMEMEGYQIKKTGSQGQQKTYLVSLKLAKFDFIRKETSKKPILLLDDIFDKFDASRFEKMIQLIGNDNFGQIFITDTDTERLHSILSEVDQDHKIFNISEGQQITVI
jgi:DNA replication and repair protein RecF